MGTPHRPLTAWPRFRTVRFLAMPNWVLARRRRSSWPLVPAQHEGQASGGGWMDGVGDTLGAILAQVGPTRWGTSIGVAARSM